MLYIPWGVGNSGRRRLARRNHRPCTRSRSRLCRETARTVSKPEKLEELRFINAVEQFARTDRDLVVEARALEPRSVPVGDTGGTVVLRPARCGRRPEDFINRSPGSRRTRTERRRRVARVSRRDHAGQRGARALPAAMVWLLAHRRHPRAGAGVPLRAGRQRQIRPRQRPHAHRRQLRRDGDDGRLPRQPGVTALHRARHARRRPPGRASEIDPGRYWAEGRSRRSPAAIRSPPDTCGRTTSPSRRC